MGEHWQIKIRTKGKIRIPLKKIEINCMHFIVIFDREIAHSARGPTSGSYCYVVMLELLF